MPSIPPTAGQPYTGEQATASARASVQYALDHYKPGSLSHGFQPSEADLSRSDSRSFGVTHASELSSIVTPESRHSSRPGTPSRHESNASVSSTVGSHHGPVPLPIPSPGSPSVNPMTLNNEPAQIPSSPKRHSGTLSGHGVLHLQTDEPSLKESAEVLPGVEGPTVAETGVPMSAGADGPGPASGSIHDLRARQNSKHSPGASPMPSSFPLPEKTPRTSFSSNTIPGSAPPSSFHGDLPPSAGLFTNVSPLSASNASALPGYGGGSGNASSGVGGEPAKLESAEEEKARLQREERDRLLMAGSSASASGSETTVQPPAVQKYETAEQEKNRLEREERERLLRGSSTSGAGQDQGKKDNDEPEGQPPAYQDF